jgi:hypothetical protein
MMKNIALMLILFVLSIACGGGGGGSSSSSGETVTTFSIRPKAVNETWSLSGTDTAGGIYTGQTVTSVGSTTSFNGNSAIPFTGVSSLTNTANNNATTNSTVISYWSTDLSTFLGQNIVTNSEIYLPTSTLNPVPETADIGDSALVGTIISDLSSDTITLSWSLTRASSSTAYFNLTLSYSNGIESQAIYTITPDGTRTNLTQQVYYPSVPATMNLNGTLQ